MTTTKNLLSEGAKSYIDALTAVRAFERACDVCKGVYDKNKPRLVRKMWLQDGQREDHDTQDLPCEAHSSYQNQEFTARGSSPSGRILARTGRRDGRVDWRFAPLIFVIHIRQKAEL